MKDTDIELMAAVADTHWWHRAKTHLVAQEIRGARAELARAVDAGCGTGQLLATLGTVGFESVVGVDPSPVALSHARAAAGSAKLIEGAAERIALMTGAATCLTSLDVVEHCVDDVAAVREYARVVKPGGTILIVVPAYQWMWSDHDVALGHQRRYTRTTLCRLVENAGAASAQGNVLPQLAPPPGCIAAQNAVAAAPR